MMLDDEEEYVESGDGNDRCLDYPGYGNNEGNGYGSGTSYINGDGRELYLEFSSLHSVGEHGNGKSVIYE